MNENKEHDSVRAVDRALEILLAFHPGESRVSASELLRRVELSRPTLYRLLHTLEKRGFVASSGEPQRFSLGPAIAQLSQAWSSGNDITALARPVMDQLWKDTGETVALLMHSGRDRVCTAELPSPQPLSFRRGVGHRENVTLGASGRAIIAFLPNQDSYLATVPPERRQAYEIELKRIRADGYAVSRDELIAGAIAMAAPIFMASQQVVGSLAVYGPSVRIGEKQIGQISEMLLKASAQISQSLGAYAIPL